MKDPSYIRGLARTQKQTASRKQLLALYGNSTITRNVKRGLWTPSVRGAVALSPGEPDDVQRLVSACVVTGGAASNRAAWPVWELDGHDAASPEITIGITKSPRLPGVKVHRSRQWGDDQRTERNGIPVVIIERCLAEGGRYLPEKIVEYGLESALRRKLTSIQKLWAYLEAGGILLPGAKVLEHLLKVRPEGGPAGSMPEVDFSRLLRAHGIDHVRQHRVKLASGRVAVIDLAIPKAKLGLEYQGRAHHDTTSAEAGDFDRICELEADDWLIKEVRSTVLRTRPHALVTMILRILEERT